MKLYGTDSETFVMADDGTIYLVQSPYFPPEKECEIVSELPPEAIELPESLCHDLELPTYITD